MYVDRHVDTSTQVDKHEDKDLGRQTFRDVGKYPDNNLNTWQVGKQVSRQVGIDVIKFTDRHIDGCIDGQHIQCPYSICPGF